MPGALFTEGNTQSTPGRKVIKKKKSCSYLFRQQFMFWGRKEAENHSEREVKRTSCSLSDLKSRTRKLVGERSGKHKCQSMRTQRERSPPHFTLLVAPDTSSFQTPLTRSGFELMTSIPLPTLTNHLDPSGKFRV